MLINEIQQYRVILENNGSNPETLAKYIRLGETDEDSFTIVFNLPVDDVVGDGYHVTFITSDSITIPAPNGTYQYESLVIRFKCNDYDAAYEWFDEGHYTPMLYDHLVASGISRSALQELTPSGDNDGTYLDMSGNVIQEIANAAGLALLDDHVGFMINQYGLDVLHLKNPNEQLRPFKYSIMKYILSTMKRPNWEMGINNWRQPRQADITNIPKMVNDLIAAGLAWPELELIQQGFASNLNHDN